MFPNNTLRVTLWFVCLFSVVANMVVIVSRINSKLPVMRRMFSTTVNTSQNALLLNLAVADFLMGVYLLAIGIADAKFGKDYYWFALNWRKGKQCKIIGFIGLLSNVVSVLTLTIVSIERFLNIVFTFSKFQFGSKLTKISCFAIWITGIFMALTPIILTEFFTDIFGFSDICLGLPFVPVPETVDNYINVKYDIYKGFIQTTSERDDVKDVQWVYSQIVYIYFSSTCAIIITLCYMAMFTST
ncbi:Relaxin receptor 2 [Holothuria leucospilota]|uniref:Relaxin receptor 2 n=1 Tax=Holothuria leucospilota TaxID=206669 RepID=A0A9Q1BXN5_HOLLE|nr:Relaxin receptor 2 [Holothuria leucospilota]